MHNSSYFEGPFLQIYYARSFFFLILSLAQLCQVTFLSLFFALSVWSSSVVAPAAGAAPGGTPVSVLDVEVDNLDKRLGLCLGGKEEVGIFNRFMFGV